MAPNMKTMAAVLLEVGLTTGGGRRRVAARPFRPTGGAGRTAATLAGQSGRGRAVELSVRVQRQRR